MMRIDWKKLGCCQRNSNNFAIWEIVSFPVWYILKSSDNTGVVQFLGSSNVLPVPAAYIP